MELAGYSCAVAIAKSYEPQPSKKSFGLLRSREQRRRRTRPRPSSQALRLSTSPLVSQYDETVWTDGDPLCRRAAGRGGAEQSLLTRRRRFVRLQLRRSSQTPVRPHLGYVEGGCRAHLQHRRSFGMGRGERRPRRRPQPRRPDFSHRPEEVRPTFSRSPALVGRQIRSSGSGGQIRTQPSRVSRHGSLRVTAPSDLIRCSFPSVWRSLCTRPRATISVGFLFCFFLRRPFMASLL